MAILSWNTFPLRRAFFPAYWGPSKPIKGTTPGAGRALKLLNYMPVVRQAGFESRLARQRQAYTGAGTFSTCTGVVKIVVGEHVIEKLIQVLCHRLGDGAFLNLSPGAVRAGMLPRSQSCIRQDAG